MKKTKAKTRKILSIFILLFIMFGGVVAINASVIENPTIIEFADEALYEKVALELVINNFKIQQQKDDETIPRLGIRISADDIVNITEMSLQGTSGSQINNLSGLEKFTYLETLDLSGNAITTMSSICDDVDADLNNIKVLNLARNPVNQEMLDSLSKLTSLTTLNMENTQLNSLEKFTTLVNLQNLILSDNQLNDLSPIASLTEITKLDISNNSSIPTIGTITDLEGLKYLNITSTGLTTLWGIQEFEQLEELHAANIVGLQKDDNRLDALYSVNEAKEASLKNLKKLDLSNSGIVETTDSQGNIIQTANQAKVDFKKLATITTLEELHLENMGITDLGGISNLSNLKMLDLANNKIESDDLEDIIVETNDVVQEENVLSATHIELQDNEIIDISIFAKYPANIQYLDLRRNHVYDTTPLAKHGLSERIDLRQQEINFSIYDKKVDVDHYIILPEIFQSSKKEGSIVYSENNFTTTGITLNENYTNPDEYNVIIGFDKTKDDVLNIKINGGNADGTTLTYGIGQSKSKSHNEYVTESLHFNDDNFYQAMVSEIENDPQGQDYARYIGDSFKRVPNKIININREVIDRMKLLYFDNKSISDITGIENCSEVTDLYLNGNDILTIQPLEACTKLVKLALANNKNMGNNNTAIEKLTKLTYLDLSNTGMSNIDSINNYITNLKTYRLVDLNISDNGLESIDGLEKITTLQNLYIANEQLDDDDLSVIQDLNGLVTLDFSGNEISDISIVSKLTNLTYLYFNNNKVESIEPLRGKVFTELKFSGNKVKDITPLSSHNSINKLIMDSNQIEDVTILQNILISDEFSATGQQITRTISEDETGEVIIELPQIFKAAKDTNYSDSIYTTNDLILTNCTLDTTGENIIINVDEIDSTVAQVRIYQGKANGTTLSVAIPLRASIQYSVPNETLTNQDVTATISFNRNDVIIKNNGGKNTYTFTENAEFTFEYEDKYGFVGNAKALVSNIDKDAPVITGVENDKVYNISVTPVIQDANIDVVTLTKDNVTLDDYIVGNTIEESGMYVLSATDKLQQTTTVSFEISVSDIITSTSTTITVTEDETNPHIRGIQPKTSVFQMMQNLQADMSFEVLDKDGNVVKNTTAKIGTGYKIKMANGKLYTLIVLGDLTGDGEISISELAVASRVATQPNTQISELQLLAMDVSKDGYIKIPDLAVLSRLKNEI